MLSALIFDASSVSSFFGFVLPFCFKQNLLLLHPFQQLSLVLLAASSFCFDPLLLEVEPPSAWSALLDAFCWMLLLDPCFCLILVSAWCFLLDSCRSLILMFDPSAAATTTAAATSTTTNSPVPCVCPFTPVLYTLLYCPIYPLISCQELVFQSRWWISAQMDRSNLT
jgi:hypothetical protein